MDPEPPVRRRGASPQQPCVPTGRRELATGAEVGCTRPPTGAPRGSAHCIPLKSRRHVRAAMRALTLYQYETCPFCGKVRRLLRQMGLAFEQVEVDRDDPTTLEGLGSETVPVLRDGDRVMNESAAICSYLVETYGG